MADEVRVLVLFTGGTIGMLHSPTEGYVPVKGFLQKNLRSQARFHDPLQDSIFAHSQSAQAFSAWSKKEKNTDGASGSSTPTTPDSGEDGGVHLEVLTSEGPVSLLSLVTPTSAQGKHVRYAILEHEKLIDSSEVEMSDWIRISSDIERNYSRFDGFVILHGTDTMAFSASGLSFLLEDLGKTVVLTGAQIPLSALRNDSIDNLLSSLLIAGCYLIPEVCLFFNHKLFRGNRSIKVSSADFDAFATPSFPPLAVVGIDIKVNWEEVLRPGKRPFRAHKAVSDEVGSLRIIPGISGKSVRAFLSTVRGVVLETYGAGNAPRRPELLSAFREASERGVVIVNVSQCANGSVKQSLYLPGRELESCGIVSGADLTTECALAKLSYLLSKPELTPAQIRLLIERPFRGELTVTSPVPRYSSPLDGPSDRLRSLFAQVMDWAPTNPTNDLVSNGGPTGQLPLEFESPWPATQADTLAAERALLPLLLCQASSRSGPLLATLIESLEPTAMDGDTSFPALTILNEPCSPSLHTPLHIAVLSLQPDNVALLLARGASVHSRDILSHSMLFYAAQPGGEGKEIVKLLRAAGALLGELEIERGAVGNEILRAEKAHNEEAVEVWKLATGNEKNYERAKRYLLDLLD